MRLRSRELNISDYDTDKGGLYFNVYDHLFAELVDEEVKILELGIYHGGSLKLWHDYFPQGTVVGIDLNIPDTAFPERVYAHRCDQADMRTLSAICNQYAEEGFDIIIDDASHIGILTKMSFWHLFRNHLKSGGYYIIEDWGTGYWDDWADGKSLDLDENQYANEATYPYHFPLEELKKPLQNHSHGMVGVIKQLVDEMGADAATKKQFHLPSTRSSRFESLSLYPGLCVIKKNVFDPIRWKEQLDAVSTLLNKGEIIQSKELFELLLVDRDDIQLFKGLVRCLIALDEHLKALTILKKAITLYADEPEFYLHLGNIMNKLNQNQEAEKYFVMAKSLQQKNKE